MTAERPETPRTDAELFREHWGGEHVRAEFARTLERELTTALARVAELERDAGRWKLFSKMAHTEQEAVDLMAACAGIAYSYQVNISVIGAATTPEQLLDAAIDAAMKGKP